MKEWFSSKDLAGLPLLPTTERRIRAKADRENWKKQKKSKGKGFEYHIDSIEKYAPEAAAELRHRYAVAAVNESIRKETIKNAASEAALFALKIKEEEEKKQAEAERIRMKNLREFGKLPRNHPKKRRANARRWMIDRLNQYRIEHYTGKPCLEKTREKFCQLVMQKDIEVPEDIMAEMPKYKGVKTLNKESLQRWEDAYKKDGIMALVPAWGKNKGRGIIDQNEAMRSHIIGALFENPHITSGKLHQYLSIKFAGQRVPCKKAILNWINTFKAENRQLWAYMTHPDKWKNAYMVAYGSYSQRIERLNQLWEFDSTPADVMLTDGRHSVVGVIDVYSRRVQLVVSKTSKAASVCQVLRRAMLDWGVPEIARTDNGKDYVSEQFTTALHELSITHELCIPFASEEKPFIERFFKTMSHGILDLLPGFIGHNVAERKQIEARKSFARRIMNKEEVVEISLSSTEFQQILDKWVENIYHRDPHAGLNGKTPFEVATAWRGKIKRIADERALDILLAELAGTRTITKKGIRLDNHYYIHSEMGHYAGEEVIVRRDDNDIGRIYCYRALDNQFIGVAQCPELAGISRQEVANASKASQRKKMAEQAREMRQHKKAIKENIAQVVLDHRIEQAENITALPKPATTYTTPALEQAGIAARVDDAPENQADSFDRKALMAEIEQTRQRAQVVEFETPDQIYKRWCKVREDIKSGKITDPAQIQSCENYFSQGEGKTLDEFYSDFGLSAVN